MARRYAASPWYRSDSHSFSARNRREVSNDSSKKAYPSTGSSLNGLA